MQNKTTIVGITFIMAGIRIMVDDANSWLGPQLRREMGNMKTGNVKRVNRGSRRKTNFKWKSRRENAFDWTLYSDAALI